MVVEGAGPAIIGRLSVPSQRQTSILLNAMALDLPAIQRALRESGLDGWLLYDFHGSNPIATRLSGVDRGAHLTTRRWYYLIPREGEPRALVHAIERHNLDQLPGRKF